MLSALFLDVDVWQRRHKAARQSILRAILEVTSPPSSLIQAECHAPPSARGGVPARREKPGPLGLRRYFGFSVCIFASNRLIARAASL